MNETRAIGRLRLPSVDQVLRTAAGTVAATRFGHDATVNAVRKIVAGLRQVMRDGAVLPADADMIATRALGRLEREDAPSLRRVFNLTGTVLHTNLGRAV